MPGPEGQMGIGGIAQAVHKPGVVPKSRWHWLGPAFFNEVKIATLS